MADQNPQVNQNVNNQNENDELFWWSDDIFENSDLLQPINSEVDTAHQVIKSQNDLNNFHWEVKDVTPNQNNEQLSSDDLFEEKAQEQPESNEQFDNLYDETPQDNQTQNNDISANDDIFEEEPVVEDKVEKIPEVEDLVEDEPQTNEVKEEIKEQVQEPEVVDTPEIVENPDVEETEDASQDIQETQDEEEFDDIDELDDIDEIQDREDDDENKEEWVANEVKEAPVEPEVKDDEDEDEEDDEEVEEWFVQNKEENKDEEDFHSANNMQEETVETKDSSDDDIENIAIQDYEKYDPNQFKTDVQKKFGELQWKSEKIHELVKKDQDVWFDLLWWNDDRQKTIYKITSWSDYVEIEKEELNKEDESTTTNVLSFDLYEDFDNNMSVQLFVNEIELYDEIKDLQGDPNKKMQVLEKMNKFIFLLDEEYKKIQKYKKEKEERNAVKWVFRNF